MDPHVLDLLVRELDVTDDDVVEVPGPARPVVAVAAVRGRPAGAQGRAVRAGDAPAAGGRRAGRRRLRGAARGRRPRAPPVRLVRDQRAAVHRAGGRRPAGAGHQADAVPHLRRLPDRRRADRRRRGRQAGRRPRRDQGALRRAGQHQLGPRAGARRLPRRLRPASGSRRTARPLCRAPGEGRAAPLLRTSAPATTTRGPPGSTRTSGCSPPTRTSAPTSPTCSTP